MKLSILLLGTAIGAMAVPHGGHIVRDTPSISEGVSASSTPTTLVTASSATTPSSASPSSMAPSSSVFPSSSSAIPTPTSTPVHTTPSPSPSASKPTDRLAEAEESLPVKGKYLTENANPVAKLACPSIDCYGNVTGLLDVLGSIVGA
ncbi:uncharacterized protein KD926_010415 [Aspergillus affinis]|uniref:uncharacterized protein n=1 Tax=Aspergillus affinis TaxID=1070780 RepID=UPI0022FEEA1D|nr:uncharacterized protein KD926_010415 [Aspergillus affinis]KAI9045092.1 hypothetical protein KD926_010415 [Aspergillus affinis]